MMKIASGGFIMNKKWLNNSLFKERLKTRSAKFLKAIVSAIQRSFKLTFFASFRLTDPPDSVKKYHQLLRCFKKLIYLKEVLMSCTINFHSKWNTEIQGFIAQFMRTIKKAKNSKYWKPQDHMSDAKIQRNPAIE